MRNGKEEGNESERGRKEQKRKKKNRKKGRELKGEKILETLTLTQIHTKTLSPISR